MGGRSILFEMAGNFRTLQKKKKSEAARTEKKLLVGGSRLALHKRRVRSVGPN